jgi:DNA-binding FadR family transcriptional regulator
MNLAQDARKTLRPRIHGTTARTIGVAILAGTYEPGHLFLGEIEQAEQLNISRTAYREAVRILAAKGLVDSRPKGGTRVNPRSMWNLLDPDVLAWMFEGEPTDAFVRDLFELRGVIEPAAVALAARRRGQQHLDAMRVALDDMRLHGLASAEGQAADQRFHRAILDSNVSPQGIAFPVPGNDDASRAIRLYCDAIADAVLAGKSGGAAARGADLGAMDEPPAEAALAEA